MNIGPEVRNELPARLAALWPSKGNASPLNFLTSFIHPPRAVLQISAVTTPYTCSTHTARSRALCHSESTQVGTPPPVLLAMSSLTRLVCLIHPCRQPSLTSNKSVWT